MTISTNFSCYIFSEETILNNELKYYTTHYTYTVHTTYTVYLKRFCVRTNMLHLKENSG